MLSPELQRLDSGIAAPFEIQRLDCGEIMAGGYIDYWFGHADGYHAQRVAVAVSNKLTPMIIEVTPVNERIMRLRIRKTARALRVDKEAYVRGICEGVEHHLWTGDSRPAYRGIHALRSSKPIPRCTAVRAEGGRLLTEESEVKAH